MRISNFWIYATALPLLGCAGMSSEDNQNFRSEIDRTVQIGMPLTTAQEYLAKAGFSCDSRSAAPEVTCTRYKTNVLLYSCVQRVNLALESTGQIVGIVKPKPIQCVGL